MNNEAYLELTGAGFLEDALLSYASCHGSDLLHEMEKALKTGCLDMPSEARSKVSSFFWDYVIYRMYIALSMVRGNKAGLLCVRPVVNGVKATITDLPLSLKAIALKRDMQGSYLVLGPEVESLTESHVKDRFAVYEALDRKYAAETDRKAGLTRCMEESMARMGRALDVTLPASFISFLVEETKAFMAHIARTLSSLTPEAIHKGARKHTHSLPGRFFRKFHGGNLYPALTAAAAIAAGMMLAFA